MPTNLKNFAPTIDAYGKLCAQIAELEKRQKAMREDLKDLEPGNHEGTDYILTVVASERANLDMKAVRDKLSDQFIRAHTTMTPVRTLRTKFRAPVEAIED